MQTIKYKKNHMKGWQKLHCWYNGSGILEGGMPSSQLVNVRVRRPQQLGIQIVKLLILYTVGRCEAMPAEKTLLCNFFFKMKRNKTSTFNFIQDELTDNFATGWWKKKKSSISSQVRRNISQLSNKKVLVQNIISFHLLLSVNRKKEN